MLRIALGKFRASEGAVRKPSQTLVYRVSDGKSEDWGSLPTVSRGIATMLHVPEICAKVSCFDR